MLKKSKMLLLVLVLSCLSLSFACNSSNHNYEWCFDEKSHWKVCIDKGCNEICDKENHTEGEQEKTVITESTCDLDGLEKICTKCTVCGCTISEVEKVIPKTQHLFTKKVKLSKYQKSFKNQNGNEEYYYCCENCNASSKNFTGETFEVQATRIFDKEVIAKEFLKKKATSDSPAEFYKSDSFGQHGEEVFFVNCEKPNPKSILLSLYDTSKANFSYGINWITDEKTILPQVMYKKISDTEFLYVDAEKKPYEAKDTSHFVYKANFKVEPNTKYEYYIVDYATTYQTEKVEFTTVDPSKNSFKFASFSDTQDENDPIGQNFAKALQNVSADNDFYLHSGDVCQRSRYEDEWNKMIDANSNYLNNIPLMVAPGNHDTAGNYSVSYAFYSHFNFNIPSQDTTSGVYYSYEYGNTKFIFLNTNNYNNKNDKPTGTLLDDQMTWLENELKNNTCKWTIVTMHCPLYSVAKWGSHPEWNWQSLVLREQLGPIFDKYNVDLVIQGHDHVFSKTKALNGNGVAVSENKQTIGGVQYTVNPQGTIYIMNGKTGGNNMAPNNPVLNPELYDYYQGCNYPSWAEYMVSENEIKVVVKYIQNDVVKIYQQWGIKKAS